MHAPDPSRQEPCHIIRALCLLLCAQGVSRGQAGAARAAAVRAVVAMEDDLLKELLDFSGTGVVRVSLRRFAMNAY